MPQTIDIPEVGQVEFPDSMSDADITSAIEKDIIPRANKRKALVQEQEDLEAKDQPGVFSNFLSELSDVMGRSANAQIQNAQAQSEFVRSGESLANITPRQAAIAAAVPLSLLSPEKVAGAAEGLANLANSALTPSSIAIAATAPMAPAVAIPAISLLAGKDALDKREAALKAEREGNTREATRLNTEALASFGMAAAPLAGIAAPEAARVGPDALEPPPILPRTAEAVAETDAGPRVFEMPDASSPSTESSNPRTIKIRRPSSQAKTGALSTEPQAPVAPHPDALEPSTITPTAQTATIEPFKPRPIVSMAEVQTLTAPEFVERIRANGDSITGAAIRLGRDAPLEQVPELYQLSDAAGDRSKALRAQKDWQGAAYEAGLGHFYREAAEAARASRGEIGLSVTPEQAGYSASSVNNLSDVVRSEPPSEAPKTGASEPESVEPNTTTDLPKLEAVAQRNTTQTLSDWADKVVKDKLSGSSANPYLDPEFLAAALVKGTVLLKRGVENFDEWSRPMIAQFGRDITPHLETLYQKAKQAAGSVSVAPSVTLKTEPPVIPGTGVGIDTSSAVPTKAAFEPMANPVAGFSDKVKQLWRSGANEALPNLTTSSRELGEAGVRAVTSKIVARDIGEIFGEKVLRGLDIDPNEFGAFLAEDNLRWKEEDWRSKARAAKDPEDKAMFNQAADAVGTIVGTKDSPFKTNADFEKYWERPEVKEAAERYKQMWREQKDPLFRQANDLDPDTPLPSRGQLSGMRVNMKAIDPEEKVGMAVRDSGPPISSTSRSGLVRQMATVKKFDPFRNQFTGLGQRYETDFYELMRNGFGREMPVAAQHEFLRKLIDNGDAAPSKSSYEPDLTLKGEPTHGYILNLRPWVDQGQKFIQIRKSLAPEYESVAGIKGDAAIHPALDVANKILTRASVAGLAEGTTHASNLLSFIFTGPGPTSRPLINALIKSLGRVDLVYSIPRVIARALTGSREEMIKLTEMGAAKPGYSQVKPGESGIKVAAKKLSPSFWLLDPIDKGVRLVAADLYDGFVRSGAITESSETGKREFVNQLGNYNKALQPQWLRAIRNNIMPFATAVHTFGVQGLRRMAMSPGIRDLTPAQRVAFAADIMGGWIGFVTVAASLNYLLNKDDKEVKNKFLGPDGTKLMDIGWRSEDGKVHTIPLGAISGYSRGPKVTGLLAGEEALRRGLGPAEAINQAGAAITQTGLNYLTGPLVRFGTVASTGYSPTYPPHRDAPAQAPDASPFKSQMAINIATALKEANPLIDSSIEFGKALYNGDDWGTIADEAGKKQLQRYWPKTTSPIAAKSDEDFANIVRRAKLNDFVDDTMRRARQLPEEKRRDFIEDQIDKVPADLRKATRSKLRAKGAFKQD